MCKVAPARAAATAFLTYMMIAVLRTNVRYHYRLPIMPTCATWVIPPVPFPNIKISPTTTSRRISLLRPSNGGHISCGSFQVFCWSRTGIPTDERAPGTGQGKQVRGPPATGHWSLVTGHRSLVRYGAFSGCLISTM